MKLFVGQAARLEQTENDPIPNAAARGYVTRARYLEDPQRQGDRSKQTRKHRNTHNLNGCDSVPMSTETVGYFDNRVNRQDDSVRHLETLSSNVSSPSRFDRWSPSYLKKELSVPMKPKKMKRESLEESIVEEEDAEVSYAASFLAGLRDNVGLEDDVESGRALKMTRRPKTPVFGKTVERSRTVSDLKKEPVDYSSIPKSFSSLESRGVRTRRSANSNFDWRSKTPNRRRDVDDDVDLSELLKPSHLKRL